MIAAELIGPPECPLFKRWTLLAPRIRGRVPFKVMVHHFMPERQDADVPHDHPRAFVTVVVRGGYDDLVPCWECDGAGGHSVGEVNGTPARLPCMTCRNRGVVMGDRLNAPTVRFRPAEYAHQTRTDERGAWSLVVMGPVVRPWGFWRDGRWWPLREFERVFGFAWGCGEPDDDVQ